MITKVGCCGFDVPGGMRSYYKQFDLVEIQSTFYNLPRMGTVEKWRSEAPVGFEFLPGLSLQGFGLKNRRFTQTAKPEECKRLFNQRIFSRLEQPQFIPPMNGVGLLEVIRWLGSVSKLMSEVVLVQSPPNFGCSDSDISNMEELLTTTDRKRVVICWEPRGDWNENPDRIRNVCSRLDLVHVVDIMRREPLSQHEVNYIRLHGLNQRELDYGYKVQ